MALVLYVAIDIDGASPVTLPSAMSRAAAPGYSIHDGWEGEVGLPGESHAPLRTTLYGDNFFRVSVADGAVVFRQEAAPPAHIIDANKRLFAGLMNTAGFRIRRWLYTFEDWDDDDRPFVRVLDEGVGPSRLEAAVGHFNCPSESHWAGDRAG